MERPPDYTPTSPMSLECPLCKVEAGTVCDVLPSRGIEIVHLERIKAAAAIDVANIERRDVAIKPHLIILKEVDGFPSVGGCSHCPSVVLATNATPMGMAGEHLYALNRMFAKHLRFAHLGPKLEPGFAKILDDEG